MLAQYLDLTNEINEKGEVRFEASNYDYAVIQIVGQSNAIDFKATIDSGAIQGVSDGNIISSDNYYAVYAEALFSNNVLIKSSTLGNGLYKFGVVGRYISLDGGSVTVDKLLVMLAKIS